MVRPTALSLLATASMALAAPKLDKENTGPKMLPGAYIVEFEEGASANQFRTQAEPGYKTRMEFNYELFQGISIQLNESDSAEERASQLASLPAVKKIWPVRLFDRPGLGEGVVRRNSTDDPAVLQNALHKRQSNGTCLLGNAPHVMTQVDRLHEEGITGKGIKIAVIDTGVDYHHPALGGCFGEGCRVAFGYDLVGDDYTGYNNPVPDDDPDDACDGHGTHVAGIIAAKGETPFDFSGAAPGAILGAYRVFGCGGGTVSDEVLISAFNMAYEDGADIITSSIGGRSGWSEEPWAAAVSRIVEKGVPCTLAAGNDGDSLFLSSSAADGKGVTAIASFQNINQPATLDEGFYAVDEGDRESFVWNWGWPEYFDGVERELWVTGYDLNKTNDACEPLPDDTPDLSNYNVLIRRSSECHPVDQAINIASKGARFFILYNDRDLLARLDVEFYEGTENIQGLALVPRTIGESWVKALESGSTITAEFKHFSEAEDIIVIEKNRDNGGSPSTFTSWGPTFELDVKPQFGAPGGNILSTFPIELGSFLVASGTSMATPFAAAAYALLSEARGVKPEPKLFERLFASTAKPHVYQSSGPPQEWLAPVAQQGAGLIQVYDAAYASSYLEPSSLSFNDTANHPDSLNFTIVNDDDAEIIYEITHTPTNSWYTLEEDEQSFPWFELENSPEHAELSFSSTKVTVAPGDSANIAVSATAPEGLNYKRYPYWSGYISVKGSDGSSLFLPYQGLSGSLHDATMTLEDGTTLVTNIDDQGVPIPANTTFTLPDPSGPPPDWPAGTPLFYFQVNWGSPYSSLDVVQLTADGGNKTLGPVPGLPREYAPPYGYIGSWLGELDSGEYAPAGRYQLVLRILKIFGDKSKPEDWWVVESTPFAIKYEGASN